MSATYFRRSFFERAPDEVARDLIGAFIIVRTPPPRVVARIVETEAYGGRDDPASHAYRGPTPRSQIMFGPAGFLYVYRIYGIYWCMNVVTGSEGSACAVLLRAAWLGDGDVRSLESREPVRYLSGPGNLTKALGIDGADNGRDCCVATGRVTFRPAEAALEPGQIGQTTRIGLSRGTERRSRYVWVGHPAVSPARRPKDRGGASPKP
ncbi:MAG: DNA-3-methyladenine glycosylase [Acidimicrobiales bacterium]